MHNLSCAVLVMSCDAYRDLWPPFFALFWRYWPDCPFPVYLGTNHSAHDDPRVITLRAGDREWSGRLRFCLEQIRAEYPLLLLEDYFLNQTISTNAIHDALVFLRARSGIELRLFPLPGPDLPSNGDFTVGRLHPLARYRVSTQASLWNRVELLNLLRDEESIWEFEWNGTLRSRTHADGFYSYREPIVRYRQVVERGEWFRSAASKYRNAGIGCDFSARPVMGAGRAVFKLLNRKRRNFADNIYRRRLQEHA